MHLNGGISAKIWLYNSDTEAPLPAQLATLPINTATLEDIGVSEKVHYQ